MDKMMEHSNNILFFTHVLIITVFYVAFQS